ncbi:MAG: hypothetical protein ACM3SM_05515 [Bacteroidota bacterium]
MKNSDRFKPLMLLVLAASALISLSFVDTETSFLNLRIRNIDPLGDIKKDTSVTSGYTGQETGQEELNNGQSPVSGNRLKDGTTVPDNESAVDSSSESAHGGMTGFISAIENKEYQQKPIRIAYYGDSETEGDMITQDLRDLMQSQFGGKGVGFLPVWTVDSESRVCSKPRTSGEWEHSMINQENNSNRNFGIAGAVFNVKGAGTAEFRSLKPRYRFSKVKLFYSAADTLPLSSVTDNFTMQTNSEGYYIKELTFTSSREQNYVRFSFDNPRANIYGVSLESGNGIYVDNFTLRGHSGVGLSRIPTNNLVEFSRFLDYRLIVLHFGMNVLNETVKDYTFYEKRMIGVINHFKRCFPNAGIVVVGVGDKGTKVGEEYLTDLSVLKLIQAQKRAAKKTGSAFFDAFRAMGGANSMVSWVNKGLASKDYIHISRPGARIIAKSLYTYIMSGQNNPDICYKQNEKPACVN